MINIKNYFPRIYEGVLETDALIQVENELLQGLKDELDLCLLNQYILSTDERTIAAHEEALKIINSSNDLDFRRQRIISRLSDTVPYTLNALKLKLNSLLGEGNYFISVDNNNYTIFLESYSLNQNWLHEVHVTIHKYKPANMIFVNKPLITEKVFINEEIELIERGYNYKLGSWLLGQKPFVTLEDKGVIKMAQAKSIQSDLTDYLKEKTVEKIEYIKINGTYEVRNFITKAVDNGKVVVEYIVPISSNITEITKIEMFDSVDKVLSAVTLYVPILNDVELKHIISIEEGG